MPTIEWISIERGPRFQCYTTYPPLPLLTSRDTLPSRSTYTFSAPALLLLHATILLSFTLLILYYVSSSSVQSRSFDRSSSHPLTRPACFCTNTDAKAIREIEGFLHPSYFCFPSLNPSKVSPSFPIYILSKRPFPCLFLFSTYPFAVPNYLFLHASREHRSGTIP